MKSVFIHIQITTKTIVIIHFEPQKPSIGITIGFVHYTHLSFIYSGPAYPM